MAQLFVHSFMIIAVTLAAGSPTSNPDDKAPSERSLTIRSNATSNGEKTIVAAVDDTIELHCEFRVSGWSDIQWVKFQEGDETGRDTPTRLGGSVSSSDDGMSTVTLRHVNESDGGNYSCVLTTLSSGSKSYRFQISVKDELSCNEKSCSSHGNCEETADGYTCRCRRGFIGTNCEFKDPCMNSPCVNGGTCIAHNEEFSCNCARGYGGENCSSEVCLPGICNNAGTCSIKDKRVHCQCYYNYAGNRCQHHCSMNTGRRNRYGSYSYNYRRCSTYTCKIPTYRYSSNENCVCDNSRSGGNRCMMEADVRNECSDSNICNGHGSCSDFVFGYRCDCYSYYHGTNCEFYNECQRGDNLCRIYGGTCVDLTDGYQCRNCPDGQHGDKCQYKKNPCRVTCSTSSMTAECDTRFLNEKMKTIPIYLARKTHSCRLPNARGYFRRLTIPYSDCGTKTDYEEDNVIYRNDLTVGNFGKIQAYSDSIISRAVGHFSFKMECTLSLVRNASAAGLADLSLTVNETMDLKDRHSIGITGTNIKVYKSDYSNRINSYVVGDRLYAKVTIDTGSNPTLQRGYKLYPVSCFATPGISRDGERYHLLQDGCVMDESFRYERQESSNTSAYFSFDSFSFKSNPGNLYLHCTSLACINSQAAKEEKCDVICDKESLVERTTHAPFHPKVVVNDTIMRKPGSSVRILPTKISSKDELGY